MSGRRLVAEWIRSFIAIRTVIDRKDAMNRLRCMHPARTVGLIIAVGMLAIVPAGVAGAGASLAFVVNSTVDAHDATLGDGICADSGGPSARCGPR